MNNKYLIYGLLDPFTNELRYIGRSSNGIQRPRNHFIPSKLKEFNYKNNWIKSVINKGKKPIIFVIEYLNSSNLLNDSEQFWIAYFKGLGCKLTNLTVGGGGINGYRHKNITKEKISKNNARYNSKKVVDQYGTIYNSASEASRILKINKRNVDCIARGDLKHKFSNGYTFEYLTDVLNRNDNRARRTYCTKEERAKSDKIRANKLKQKVKCIESNKIYNSLKEATTELGLASGVLSKHLKGIYKSVGNGLHFIKI